MNDVVFLTAATVASTSTVAGLWLAINRLETLWTTPTEPTAELLAVRIRLHEAAHATRVEMVRVAREASQQVRS